MCASPHSYSSPPARVQSLDIPVSSFFHNHNEPPLNVKNKRGLRRAGFEPA